MFTQVTECWAPVSNTGQQRSRAGLTAVGSVKLVYCYFGCCLGRLSSAQELEAPRAFTLESKSMNKGLTH